MGGIVKYSVIFTLFCAAFSPVIAQNDTSVSNIEGTNICRDTNNSCTCDINVHQPTIACKGMGLHVMYEQSDFQATFDGENLPENATIDLRFDENYLINIPRFAPMPVVFLVLRHNLISSIDDFAFAELKQLDYLDLSNNNLSGHSLKENVFKSAFNSSGGYFPSPLKHLNLSHNYIHTLNPKAFDPLTDLRTLDLSHNPIKTLSGTSSMTIASMMKLEFLGLANCGIKEMHDGMLHSLNMLSSLDLSGNLFVDVPRELQYTHVLQVLKLDKNKFEVLSEESFLDLGYLEDLSLNYNEKLIKIEQGTFGHLRNLTKLELSFCKRLEQLSDGAFQGLVEKGKEDVEWKLTQIYLNDNGLSQIDEALAPWDYVDYVDIRNNPFRCDCNLEWMVKNLMPKIEKMKTGLTNDINCAQPKAMRGRPITKLMLEPDLFSKCRDSKDELYPDEITIIESSSYRAAGITILVIGILLIVIGVSVIGFLVIKRRAIAKALVAHQEIRYERADSDDDGIGSMHSGKNRRPNAF
ncbi:Leucine-rich repeats and immunoglobulin-like domains protein 2 [Orchesella cincta]|uniref:Leucine-rich repeats and immunoglobulin-like domains protein 2 n=1 Tax=Orchesella cincta TaxID=48709 RepID=A0A1D2MFR3_ORCCI|nr:Leucine-rich repeats and immunoglobulin-like domains protein 2 [Orchesella cincta]